MSRSRDYLSDLRRYYLPQAGVRVSNAWDRAAGRHIQGSRARFSNWRNRRDIIQGKRDVVRRGGDEIRSRLPVVRGRINPATGLQHRRDAELGRGLDQALTRNRQAMPQRTRAGRSR